MFLQCLPNNEIRYVFVCGMQYFLDRIKDETTQLDTFSILLQAHYDWFS